ncbi:hypothetical protein VCRA2121O391_60006 [Vibrio crassostreae]|nr:hypothetical protein VCRA2117O380_130006 [Vibrio crassostreae]CAK1766445.1 hypothetical protein VCRA2117O379_130135 [Vibrio crassostreae]CAK1767347.1 hypothetical protein VCRA2119O382_130138 [Vibrio crassostreae]CAK2027374.1 hypothetical protein VCRA2119O381_390001 [Vibrio crassostreae]CAK2048687.1 hypothetical protein VCRA2113O351_30006 [Vibrio crassostreae]
MFPHSSLDSFHLKPFPYGKVNAFVDVEFQKTKRRTVWFAFCYVFQLSVVVKSQQYNVDCYYLALARNNIPAFNIFSLERKAFFYELVS